MPRISRGTKDVLKSLLYPQHQEVTLDAQTLDLSKGVGTVGRALTANHRTSLWAFGDLPSSPGTSREGFLVYSLSLPSAWHT